MSYDSSNFNPGPNTKGRLGSMIDYSAGDVTLTSSVKAVVVVATGNVVYTPVDAPSNQITITGAPVGLLLPHIPGTIVKTGSTASLATVED